MIRRKVVKFFDVEEESLVGGKWYRIIVKDSDTIVEIITEPTREEAWHQLESRGFKDWEGIKK
ncbi:MAG: hypothetical protein QMD65_00115 [Patescibacteria group bacterium]|nr:hypothetical protein [Patescibacteria group bacterium]